MSTTTIFSTYDNFMVGMSLFQCFSFLIGGLFLMAVTSSPMTYSLGFAACTLSMFSLQTLAGLYEKGPYRGDYTETSKYTNENCMLAGFSLLFGLFIDAIAMGHIRGIIPFVIYGSLALYLSTGIYKYYVLTGKFGQND